MTVPFGDFESRLLDLIDRASFTATLGSVQNQRLVLGGTRGSGGGEGGPIQPFIGKLPQTEVTFDTDEFASLTIPSGENASLLDNLNRIRIAWTIVPSGVDEQNYVVAGSGNLVEHLRGIDEALGSGWGYTIQDEGITLPRRHKLNFIGASVVAADNLGDDATDVTISVSGGGGGHVIQDEGGDLAQRTNLNFVGPTVVAADDAGNDATLVTISGSAGWPYSASTISVDLTDPDADHTTLALAVAAAVAGDTILVGPGTHTVDNVTLPDNVHLTGFGMDVTTLQTNAGSNCLQVGDGSVVLNLTVQNTYSNGAASTIALQMHTGGDTSTFERVRAIATNTAAGNAFAMYLNNSTLVHCMAEATSAGLNGYALLGKSGSNLYIHQGYYNGSGGTSTDIGTTNASDVIYIYDPILENGTINIGWGNGVVVGWWFDSSGNNNASGSVSDGTPVLNTSGGAIAAGAVGYLDSAGEFKTTTTAYSDVTWVVVLSGGVNNKMIYVTSKGRVTVVLNGNCSVGDFLYTSTTAGRAQPQSYMRPEVLAIAQTANASGAGGTCEALLHCGRVPRPVFSTTYVYGAATVSDSDFISTIATLPGGAVLTYGAVTSGSEDTIEPWGALGLPMGAQLVLTNTTRGTEALIADVVLGTNTITLTAAVPGGWQVGDSITARSQTNAGTWLGNRFYEFDMSAWAEKPTLATAIGLLISVEDSVAGGVVFHPFQAFSGAKSMEFYTTEAATRFRGQLSDFPIFQERFTVAWEASGANTAVIFMQLTGWLVASP